MEKKTWPVWALVLGILGLVGFGFLAAIPAWIVGSKAEENFESGVYTDSEKSMATVGKNLGMVGTFIGCCCFMFLLSSMGSRIRSQPQTETYIDGMRIK